MIVHPTYSVKCRKCDVLLVGRDQFIGHMIHSHEMDYKKLEEVWESLNANLLINGESHNQSWRRDPMPH